MAIEQKPFLIFDFGNVLIDIQYHNTVKALSEVLDVDWTKEGIPPDFKNWMKSLETGKISVEAFIWKFQSFSSQAVDHRAIIDAWNALLIGIPPGRIEFLQFLKSKYEVALLSNTNQIHLDWVYRHLEKQHGMSGRIFEETCFHRVFYSHDIKLRKPDREIYRYVESQIGVSGSKILFVDDLYKNVTAAREMGWTAIQHQPELRIEEALEHYITLWRSMNKKVSSKN